MFSPPNSGLASRLHSFGPALTAASAFALSDVLGKVVFDSGGDVLTLVSFRGVVGIAFMFGWLRIGAKTVPMSSRECGIALCMGVLFAGTVFGLFKAIEAMDVPTAILAYFIYPLLTGLAAALTGIESLGWKGAIAAMATFLGLALMIGAHPGEVAFAGLAFAFGAAVCRMVMLLVTRATLAKADARLSTWYSLLSSTVLFVAASLITQTWNAPHTVLGWVAMIGISAATVIALLAVFISTNRVGPIRTALIMNLEPILAAVLSAIFLDEFVSPIQALGGAIMVAALVAFQIRR